VGLLEERVGDVDGRHRRVPAVLTYVRNAAG
jgi:hypothetical protein